MKNIWKLTWLSVGLFCINFQGKAQVEAGAFGYYNDALRFSQTQNFGTARFIGIGGAGTALGGEVSAIAVNPAGLGLFNRSQLVITPTLSFNKSESSYFQNTVNEELTKLDLTNFGAVINFNKGDLNAGKWKSGSLGITYNRTNDFRQDISYRNQNNNNSIIDAMLEQANGLLPSELGGLALTGFDHYLINPMPFDETIYDSFVLGFPEQQESIRRRGTTDEIKISYGTNYDDKIYLGGGVGLVSTDYTLSRIYNETFVGEPLSRFTIDERLDVSGSGVNVNLGIILKPTDFVRIGASYTSPTWYNFNEESDAIYQSEYNNYDVADWVDDDGNRLILEDTVLGILRTETPIYVSEYNLRTPMKFNAGVTFIFKKHGFISADVEFVDYSNAHISTTDFLEEADNRTIDNLYQSVTNIKIGGEYRYDLFRFRAGYASSGDPFNSEALDGSRTVISAGAGLNFGRYFIDFAYSNTSYNESIVPYTVSGENSPMATVKHDLNQATLSFGINF